MANTHRNVEARPEPYLANDFIYWTKADAPGTAEEDIVQMDDPVLHSQLIKAAVFGIAPKAVA